jgi:hypothetical protein
MPRICVCALALLVLFLTHSVFAQHPSGNAVDVAYVLTGSGELGFRLQTYDVDSRRGYPTPEGQPLRLPPGSTSENLTSASVTVAPGDHFVYITGQTDGSEQFIWAYATDSFGVPQGSPIQTVTTTSTYDFQIDPNGKLAYVTEWGAPINIRVFDVDPDTGLLSKTSRVVQSWGEYGPCGDGGEAYPFLDGFSPKGNKLYESWTCSYWDTYGAFYYRSAIDPGTGQLGQPKEIFKWIDSGGSGDTIFFTARFMIDSYDNGGNGLNVVNVYPLTGASKPLISCTVTMLQACGDGALSLYNDPAGEYLFLELPTNTVQIAKIERATKTIVDTGNYLAKPVVTISPDRRLIYTRAPDQREPDTLPHMLGIYVFDPQTGAVQQGGEISVQRYFQMVPAVRESN